MSTPTSLSTPRLTLRRCDEAGLLALIAGNDVYEREYRTRVEPGFIEFEGAFDYSLRKARDAGADAPWWLPFLVIHTEDTAVVGVFGTKGPPAPDGFVEVGYSIAPNYQNRGLATEALGGFRAAHRDHPGVNGFRAHTLPERNASCRVLEKAGFSLAGEHFDPEDGLTWVWQLGA